MTPKVTVNTANFGRELKNYSLQTRKNIGVVVREQAKLFVRDVINMTPPFPGGQRGATLGRAVAPQTHRRAGEASLQRDIRRVFLPIDQLKIWDKTNDPRLSSQLQKAARAGDVAAVKAIFRNVGLNMDAIPTAVRALHVGARGSRGRVPKRTVPNVVLASTSVRAYETRAKKSIGYAKAGWATAARALGVKLPAWLSRHRTPGLVNDQTHRLNSPFIIIGNLVPFAEDFGPLRIVQDALKQRVIRMRAQIQHILRGGKGRAPGGG